MKNTHQSETVEIVSKSQCHIENVSSFEIRDAAASLKLHKFKTSFTQFNFPLILWNYRY